MNYHAMMSFILTYNDNTTYKIVAEFLFIFPSFIKINFDISTHFTNIQRNKYDLLRCMFLLKNKTNITEHYILF